MTTKAGNMEQLLLPIYAIEQPVDYTAQAEKHIAQFLEWLRDKQNSSGGRGVPQKVSERTGISITRMYRMLATQGNKAGGAGVFFPEISNVYDVSMDEVFGITPKPFAANDKRLQTALKIQELISSGDPMADVVCKLLRCNSDKTQVSVENAQRAKLLCKKHKQNEESVVMELSRKYCMSVWRMTNARKEAHIKNKDIAKDLAGNMNSVTYSRMLAHTPRIRKVVAWALRFGLSLDYIFDTRFAFQRIVVRDDAGCERELPMEQNPDVPKLLRSLYSLNLSTVSIVSKVANFGRKGSKKNYGFYKEQPA